MTIGTTYSFVIKHLTREIKEGFSVLETGSGAAVYRDIVEERGANYFGTDVPNQHYGNLSSVDSFCSADRLPFRDKAFNLLFNQGAIDYMPNLPLTLREAHRVLVPAGKMIIFTYREDILEMIHQNVSGSAEYWEVNHHVFSPEQLLGYLTKAGFSGRDISFDLDSWEPIGIVKGLLQVTRLYPLFNRRRSIWRVFVATKSN